MAEYKLPDGIKNMGNAYVTAGNKCGAAIRNGHILSVDTGIEEAVEEVDYMEYASDSAALNQAIDIAKDEQATAEQAKLELNDLNKNYVIDKNVIISSSADIAFKTLTLGDGTGTHISKIILNNNINPNSGKITILKGGQLIQANSSAQAISGDLVIEQGGILMHLENKTDKKYQLNLTAQNIISKPGSIVSAYAKGYSGGEARKQGLGRLAGAYIGKRASGAKVGAANDLGSGGAGGGSAKGGAGGGIIQLAARDEFSVSGIINADGQAGEAPKDNTSGGAGGAGGSIYLAAQKFSGSGSKITATGGAGIESGGAGGGGRIYIKASGGTIRGTINANGGSGEDTSSGSVVVE